MRETPVLCLLDEPTAALDAKNKDAIFSHLTRRSQALAVTSLPDLQYLDCLPQGADSFKTDTPQDTDILERDRPFRKGILPETPIAAARERSEAYLRAGELIDLLTHRHFHFTSLRT